MRPFLFIFVSFQPPLGVPRAFMYFPPLIARKLFVHLRMESRNRSRSFLFYFVIIQIIVTLIVIFN